MRKLLVLMAASVPGLANTSILSIEPTQMQALIRVVTDQQGACTYRASRGTVFSSNVADLTDDGTPTHGLDRSSTEIITSLF